MYTDVIRHMAKRYGPMSSQVHKTIHEIDDLLQARLIDARSKEEQTGKKVKLISLLFEITFSTEKEKKLKATVEY